MASALDPYTMIQDSFLFDLNTIVQPDRAPITHYNIPPPNPHRITKWSQPYIEPPKSMYTTHSNPPEYAHLSTTIPPTPTNPTESSHTSNPTDNPQPTAQPTKKQIRNARYRDRNREAARRSREKQRELTEVLEMRTVALESKRDALLDEVEGLKRTVQELSRVLYCFVDSGSRAVGTGLCVCCGDACVAGWV
ncbi:hypothetical protein BDV25DRAFT_70139 [Aspergillus avenaceus]|uniref:BZIP domain-containing protein n=1 Tax=Aspergillus avenaceus TaxID=36643 RepID=A0A5N6U184_ASPAV|nr:hypothetical protein BDV25DRAFT_70139 [Aspergillus avenaceus]